jgi:hypothetical protein
VLLSDLNIIYSIFLAIYTGRLEIVSASLCRCKYLEKIMKNLKMEIDPTDIFFIDLKI